VSAISSGEFINGLDDLGGAHKVGVYGLIGIEFLSDFIDETFERVLFFSEDVLHITNKLS
jgi:hypothetical protein